ncbi:PPK2 family polyphosphate kinase [Ilumatobacter sp.]|uniref:PPK2 family polyphosphate kinase n=1 Tax=Ilumatobacter sp. TaxID=1967498 RepID=UPI003B51FF2E
MSDRPDSFLDHHRIDSEGEPVVIDGYDTRASFLDEDEAEDELTDVHRPRLYDLLDVMMANEEHAVLLVLQGSDCSGKSGTLKHVVQAMNPVGVRVSTFAEPTEEERAEHHLDRIRRGLPRPGEFAVFDRSYYEDVIVPRVEGELDGEEFTDDMFEERLAEVLAFEDELAERGITVVKCFLNISYDEQRERFLRRIRRPDKHRKFELSDLDSRARWPEYRVAYGEVVGRTSTEAHPWHVVPVDHKWHRNWVIAQMLVEVFESFDEEYPPLEWDADELRAALEPPN